MNANELADEILYRYADEGGNYSNGFFKAIETMLRQQQAEIGALRMMLANRNDALDKLDLKSTPCKYTEGM